jgi:DNA-binding transcriptional MerR regulator
MPFESDGQLMYPIGEALVSAELSRATFFRWVKEGKVDDARFRDRNGRRVFSADQVDQLRSFNRHLTEASPQLSMPFKQSHR